MTEKHKIGADGEFEETFAYPRQKSKRSDPIWRRLPYSPLIPFLVFLQTAILLVICVGAGLLITGTINLPDIQCRLNANCTSPANRPVLPSPITNLTSKSAITVSNDPCDASVQSGISFISDYFAPFGAVYLVDPAGTHTCRFYEDSQGIYTLAWSPDGQSMAYVSSSGLMLVNRTGKDKVVLYSADIRHDSIDWSPDGTQIAFSVYPADKNNGSAEIMVVKISDKTTRVLTDSLGADYAPAWSPDGKHIAFVSDRDGGNRVYIMDSDGTIQHRLTSDSTDEIAPAWSPDGTRLAYSSMGDSVFHVVIRDLGSGTVQPISLSAARAITPRWSPDGRQIVFVAYLDGNNEIYISAIDGTGTIKKLTSSRSDDFSPSWIR